MSTTTGKIAHFMEAPRMMRRGPTTTDTGWKVGVTVRNGFVVVNWKKGLETKGYDFGKLQSKKIR